MKRIQVDSRIRSMIEDDTALTDYFKGQIGDDETYLFELVADLDDYSKKRVVTVLEKLQFYLNNSIKRTVSIGTTELPVPEETDITPTKPRTKK